MSDTNPAPTPPEAPAPENPPKRGSSLTSLGIAVAITFAGGFLLARAGSNTAPPPAAAQAVPMPPSPRTIASLGPALFRRGPNGPVMMNRLPMPPDEIARRLQEEKGHRNSAAQAMPEAELHAAPGSAPAPSADDHDTRIALEALRPQVQQCLTSKAVAPNGQATFSFTLQRDPQKGAHVVEPRLASSTLGAPESEGCVLEALKRAEFPEIKGTGSVQVNYPVHAAVEGRP